MLVRKMDPVPVSELEEAERAFAAALANLSGPEADEIREAVMPAFNLYVMAWARLHMNANYYIA